VATTWILATALAACGGGSGSRNSASANADSTTATYTIGGSISGLANGAQVALQNNGADALILSANGAFRFATPVAASGNYAVTVSGQPTGEICSLAGGTGSGSGVTASVSNVNVVCSSYTYSIGGTVTGLATGAQLTLQNNGADALTVNANGTFTFATPIAYDGSYRVTVSAQPTGEICSLTGGTGSGSGVTASIGDVSIGCSSDTHTIGGTVTGLASGEHVTLQNNGADALTVNANGAFTFATPVAYNGSYTVTVNGQPLGRICSVTGGTGSGSGVTSNIGTVSIVCSSNTFTIGGTVTGLASGAQVTLQDNGANAVTVNANGSFAFTTPVAYNGSYAITVSTQPTGQICSLTGGTGSASGVIANVSNVALTCSTDTYAVGGTVAGLANGTQLTLQDNGANALTVSTNGAFTFTAPIAYNGSYAVTVSSQPTEQTCSVTNAAGSSVTANVASVSVSCAPQAISSNALDRINFGDTASDAFSESAHAFVNAGQPTGAGSLGLTYREIAPSAVAASVGNNADNEALTFTMTCSPTLQNYVTIQVWGSDTISDYIYLYTPTQGNVTGNYSGTNQPEIDNQGSDPVLPGRWLYETLPIPLSMTSGKTSVTLTLNAALTAGTTSRPIYSAFTHTSPYLIVSPSDPQGTAPAAAAPTPSTYNSAYFSSILNNLSGYVSVSEGYQLYGPTWTAAVNAGTVPVQVIGSFGLHPAPSQQTYAGWLNADAVYTQGGNNVIMQRLEMLAFAYVTPNFLTSFYQNSDTEQRIVAALDSYSYMQALDGCWGDMTEWDGVGATTTSSSNPFGRQNAQCSPIEGQGTWALGAAILQMQGDSSFRAALNQPISSTLEPGVLRYRAYQTMLVNNINFLTSPIGHGHAPNQDLLQARSYVYSNLALRALDKLYGTSLARSNAQMYSDYLNETAGIVLSPAEDLSISNGGLGLEKNGSLNGSFDGGYGWLDALYLSNLAKILNDNGIETATYHPVRTVAINAAHAFSNFIYPSLVASGSSYSTTMRSEQALTFRWSANVGPIATLQLYFAAAEFNDPYALHGLYLEHANGITWSPEPYVGASQSDNVAISYMLAYADYVTLCNMVTSQPIDPSGVTFLNEPAHADGVWADPTGSTIMIKHAGERLGMVLNWRPLMTPGVSTALSPSEPMDNVARVHDTTATTDRIATINMPASAATGASGNYTSGAAETLYIGRYGNYLVGLNRQPSVATMTLPPDMTLGTATDLVSGTTYDLTKTRSITVPPLGSIVLFQSLPTWAGK